MLWVSNNKFNNSFIHKVKQHSRDYNLTSSTSSKHFYRLLYQPKKLPAQQFIKKCNYYYITRLTFSQYEESIVILTPTNHFYIYLCCVIAVVDYHLNIDNKGENCVVEIITHLLIVVL